MHVTVLILNPHRLPLTPASGQGHASEASGPPAQAADLPLLSLTHCHERCLVSLQVRWQRLHRPSGPIWPDLIKCCQLAAAMLSSSAIRRLSLAAATPDTHTYSHTSVPLTTPESSHILLLLLFLTLPHPTRHLHHPCPPMSGLLPPNFSLGAENWGSLPLLVSQARRTHSFGSALCAA